MSTFSCLSKLGRVDEQFTKPDVVFNNAKKLSALLPDANVPNMLQREPDVLNLNFVRARDIRAAVGTLLE